MNQVWILGQLAQYNLYRKNYRGALENATAALKLTRANQPVLYYVYTGYVHTATVYLTLWAEPAFHDLSKQELQKLARQAVNEMKRYASAFNLGLPAAHRLQGWYVWLAGQERKAFQEWEKGLAKAAEFNMPYEEGMVHFELGCHLTAGESGRDTHLQQAHKIFTKIGAARELAQVKALL
ncbi:MAG: hypothetical protein KDE51_23050 [Anaerolineales bacterium]|nr:hypothetical protein [Anaerolineales bacterium]